MKFPLSMMVLIEQLVLTGDKGVPLSYGVDIRSNPPKPANIFSPRTYHRYRY